MSVGILAPNEREVVAQRGDARREQLLQLGFDAVLLEARVVAELDARVVQDLVQLDAQRLALRVRATIVVVGLVDRARRVHPVERLVRRVGVHRDRAVGLAHEQSHGAAEARAEPSLVDDRAAGDEQAHRGVGTRGPYPGRVQPPSRRRIDRAAAATVFGIAAARCCSRPCSAGSRPRWPPAVIRRPRPTSWR